MSAVFPPRCAERFRHVAELARGGYGTVHRAVQVALERPVVVKLLHAATQEPEALARFAAEARVTASLADAHIVVVIDHDVSDAAPWIAYEELPGPDVRKILDAGVPPLAEATRIVAHVASALAAAHAHGVLHRDIKPENVLAAGPGIYKVTDFGIAKWSGAGVATADGTILGTPAYLSPEVCEGKTARPASDVYALGVMFYELLAGGRPFAQDAVLELLTAHVRDTPPRISGLAPALDDVLMRMLAKSPLARPPLDEVRAVLAPFHGEEAAPVRARSRPSGRLQATKAGSRPVLAVTTQKSTPAPPRRWPLALGAALALGAGLALLARPKPEPKPSPTPNPVATVLASPSPLITLERVKHLTVRAPTKAKLQEWERAGQVWLLAQHALDFEHDLKKAENLIGKRAPDEGGAKGDELANRTVFANQLVYRRILQNQADGKGDAARHIPKFQAELGFFEKKPVYARCARLHAFLAELSLHQRDPAGVIRHGLRALAIDPALDFQYVRQAHTVPDTLNDVGFAVCVGGGRLTSEAGLHLMKVAWESDPHNAGYAPSYARELAKIDPAAAERVLDRAGPPPKPTFWAVEGYFEVARLNGRVGRALRALETMAAAPERDEAHLKVCVRHLAEHAPAYMQKLEPFELLVELEADWDWVRAHRAVADEVERLGVHHPLIKAALVARGLGEYGRDQALALELAAEAAGALRVQLELARRRGDTTGLDVTIAKLPEPAARRALRLELARREPPDDITRALAADLVARIPAECGPLVDRLLAVGPPDAALLARVARVRRHQGRPDDAIGYAERALKLVPDHLPATEELVAVLQGQSRYDELLARTRAVRGRADLSLDLVSNIAEAETTVGEPAEAIALLDAALARMGAVHAAWVLRLRRGDALLRLGRLDEAQAAFEQVGKATQDDAPSLDARARLAAKRGQDEAATALFERALARNDSFWIHKNYAFFLKSRNRIKESQEHVKRAAALVEGLKR